MIYQPSPLERRVAAAQQLLDEWKGRPFSWKNGGHCARMVADHLRRMGYTPPLAKAGPIVSALSAKRALVRLKVATLADAIDLVGLPRIAPAAALVGDIIELPGEGELGCMTVALGNGRTLGFHQEATGAVVLQPVQYVSAWRVEPI